MFLTSSIVPSHPETETSEDDDDDSGDGDEHSDQKLSIAISPSHSTKPLSESPFKCEVCGKEFSARQPWQRHAMVHTGEKPYACTTCPARFRCTSHLKRHMRLHTGERPCQCPLCPKAYTDNPNLLRHMTIVHGCRAYECEMCSSSFALERELRAHLVDVHKVQILPVSCALRASNKLHLPHNSDEHSSMPPAPARVLSRRLYRPRDVAPGQQVQDPVAAATPAGSSPSAPGTSSGADPAAGTAVATVPGTPGVIPVRRGRGRPKGSKNHPRPPLVASPLQAQAVPSGAKAHASAITSPLAGEDQLAKRARLVPESGMADAVGYNSVVGVPPLLLATSSASPVTGDGADPKAAASAAAAAAAAAANPWMALYQNPLLAMQAQLMQAQMVHVQWAYMAQMAQLARWAQSGGTEGPAVVPSASAADTPAATMPTNSPTGSIEEAALPESMPMAVPMEKEAAPIIETPVKTEDVSS